MLYEESKIDISELEDFDINLDWKKGILFYARLAADVLSGRPYL